MAQQPAGRRPRLAWALLGLTVVLLAASVLIGLARGQTWNAKFSFIAVSLPFSVVGALVAARTGNRLGWLFLAAATVSAVTVLAAAYAGPAPPLNCRERRGWPGCSAWPWALPGRCSF
jgi:peptidoglycan/LPS O-acetylase OafA/YrhL